MTQHLVKVVVFVEAKDAVAARAIVDTAMLDTVAVMNANAIGWVDVTSVEAHEADEYVA